MSHLSSRLGVCFVVLLGTTSCDKRVADQRTSVPVEDVPVNNAVGKYSLTMTGIRRWYSVVEELERHSRVDTTYRFSLNYRINAPLRTYTSTIEADTVFQRTLRENGLSAEEFVVLTTIVGTGWAATRMVESAGMAAKPENVGPELIGFFRENRQELDSLSQRLRVKKP
jgi:hypothetical protein